MRFDRWLRGRDPDATAETDPEASNRPSMPDRRGALKLLGGSLAALGAGKAVDNVLIGYGILTGTNLVDADLQAVAREGFPPDTGATSTAQATLRREGETLTMTAPKDTDRRVLDLRSAAPEEARAVDERFGLPEGPVEEVVTDVQDLTRGNVTFAFSDTPTFFERLRRGSTRPHTVGLARGQTAKGDPAVVRDFTAADPRDPAAVVTGLKEGFRTYAGYDLERYAAGSVQDNVLFRAVDLRARFREPVDFRTVMENDDVGMFCYEFTDRSIEALHAVPAPAQTAPVAAVPVGDRRHKHVYTGIASAIRINGDLVIPMTFVDYTHSTLYDDLNLRGLLGEGLEAYDRRHRATEVRWS